MSIVSSNLRAYDNIDSSNYYHHDENKIWSEKKIRIHSIIMKANLIEPIKNSTTFKPVGMRFSILRLRTPLIITLKKQRCAFSSSYY